MKEFKGRLQLKNDTEANWIRAGDAGFVPLAGELIIYNADDNHSYSRIKLGDGTTNIKLLPFIDSATVNGEEVEVVKGEFSNFPSPGSEDKLYIDAVNNRIYHYDALSGYTQISNFSLTVTKGSVTKVTSWTPGSMTEVSVNDNILKLNNGILPELLYYNTEVVTNVTKG